MKKTIITSAISNFNNGMVADGNLIEYPPNSAKVLKNVDYTKNDVLVRRPGIGAYGNWSAPYSMYRTYLWEYSPQEFVIVNVDYNRLSVHNATTGAELKSWGIITSVVDSYGVKENDFMVDTAGSNTISFEYVSQTPPGGADVVITASDYFDALSTARAAGTVTLSQSMSVDAFSGNYSDKNLNTYFDYSGVRYIRRSVYNSTAPTTLISPKYPVPTSFSASPGSWYQFAAFKNTCVVTNELGIAWCIWAKSDSSGAHFYADYVNMARRVYEDLPDGVGANEQPANTVSNANLQLNLLNRGWKAADITSYKAAKSKWPAKSMVPWRGKDGTGAFSPTEIDKVFFGSTSAPVGSTIYPVYSTDKTGVTAVCSAFGRYFYGGFHGGILGNSVMYSQIISRDEFVGDQIGACYSVNDPTAEYVNEGTAVDGGYIRIEGANKIVKLLRFKDGVLIFARNGVWYLTGIQGQVFQGNAFNLYKITDKGILNGFAAGELDDEVLYASDDGIYGIAVDPQTRSLSAENITDNRISKFYGEQVSTLSESYTGSIITHLYSATGPGITVVKDKKNKELLFILNTSSVTLIGNFAGATDGGVVLEQPSLIPTGTVLVYNQRRKSWRYYTIGESGGYDSYNFGYTNSDGTVTLTDKVGKPYRFTRDSTASANNYKDDLWTSSGVSTLVQAAYGSRVSISAKNAMVDPIKQLAAVRTHFQNSDYKVGADPIVTGSCLMSVVWDTAASSNTARVTPAQEAYRNVPNRQATVSTVGDGYDTNWTRLIVRGLGHHYSIVYDSSGVADFKLIGYSLDIEYSTRELMQIARGG